MPSDGQEQVDVSPHDLSDESGLESRPRRSTISCTNLCQLILFILLLTVLKQRFLSSSLLDNSSESETQTESTLRVDDDDHVSEKQYRTTRAPRSGVFDLDEESLTQAPTVLRATPSPSMSTSLEPTFSPPATSLSSTSSPSVSSTNPHNPHTILLPSDSFPVNRTYDSFSNFLDVYSQFHSQVTSGMRKNSTDAKFVTFHCSGRGCGGWGNRVLGIYQAAILAFVTNRVLLIEDVEGDADLSLFYRNDSEFHWSYRPSKLASSKRVRCINAKCDCIPTLLDLVNPNHTLDSLARYDEIVVESNMDCNAELAAWPQFHEIARRIHLTDELWQREFFARTFPPTKLLERELLKVINVSLNGNLSGEVIKVPSMGIHIRTGTGTNDFTHRFDGTLESLLDRYVSCFSTIQSRLSISASDSVIFIAVDVDTALTALKERLERLGWRVITASSLGGIGHVERNANVQGMSIRLHVEYELLRYCKTMILGSRSSFSHTAFETRVHPGDEVAYEGEEGCKPVSAPLKRGRLLNQP